MTKKILSRRDLIKCSSTATFLSMTSSLIPGLGKKLFAQSIPEPKYLFIVAASGGASIVDSFLAQTQGPTAFSEQQIGRVVGSEFNCVLPMESSIQGAIPLGNGYSQLDFLRKHKDDMVVMAHNVSSVNHHIAAKRSISGNNINGNGITLAEAMAMRFGNGLAIPNANMAIGGYAEDGDNPNVPALARTQLISDPLMFAFATSGFQGIKGTLSGSELQIARKMRQDIEKSARNFDQYANNDIVKSYLDNRAYLADSLEKGNTMSKFMLYDDPSVNLADFGIQLSESFVLLNQRFPNMASDPFEAKMALAYLLTKEKISCCVTVSPGSNPIISPSGSPNTPIAFDWSHSDHRGAQNAMWSYILKSTDSLIDLLKSTDVDGDPVNGKMWDRSLIYFATEFGRDKVSSGGSGHHLNNGSLMISPMLKGNRLFGGINSDGLTFGFDPKTGLPASDKTMDEADVYSAVALALGIEFEGQSDLSIMKV